MKNIVYVFVIALLVFGCKKDECKDPVVQFGKQTGKTIRSWKWMIDQSARGKGDFALASADTLAIMAIQEIIPVYEAEIKAQYSAGLGVYLDAFRDKEDDLSFKTLKLCVDKTIMEVAPQTAHDLKDFLGWDYSLVKDDDVKQWRKNKIINFFHEKVDFKNSVYSFYEDELRDYFIQYRKNPDYKPTLPDTSE